MKILLHIITLIFLTASCNSSKESVAANTIENHNKVQNTSLHSGSYNITQIGTNSTFKPGLTITFDEKSNKVTGFSGCNTFMGSYSTEGKTISFNRIATTKKFCKEEINTIENHVLKALNEVNYFSIQNEALQLLKNDTLLIQARRTSESSKSDMVKNSYDTSIVYIVSTRAYYDYISISASDILISKDRGLQDVTHYKCEEQDWNELNTLIDAVDLETFQKLEAPSEQRFSDIKPEASLAIQLGDIQYKTLGFDHGNPPEAIEALVNKVLSIKEKTIKQ